MPSHALEQHLFDQTAGLTDENNILSASSPNRVNLIDGWLKVVEGNERTELIEEKLKELRDQLKLDRPDADLVQELLLSLADSTSQIAQGSAMQEPVVNRLEQLATTLRRLAGFQVVTTK